MKLPSWTKSAGTGGFIAKPEDFAVKEILHRKYFAKYKTSGSVRKQEGKYNLFLLKKRNMTTHEALEILRKKFNVGKIGFAGLKDKRAVTEQYITMEGGGDFKEKNISLTKTGTTDRMLSKGDLVGNEFVITLHGCRASLLPAAVAEINKRGVPNYFGPQRFGARGNNHVIGKAIVKRQFKKALQMINKNHGRNYGEIHRASKEMLKFYVNAYQSRIFNELLAEYVRKRKYFAGYIPIIGCNTKEPGKAPQILGKEGIKPRDFMVKELKIACRGGLRKAFIKTFVGYKIINNKVTLGFTLPAGSYATVVLREVTK